MSESKESWNLVLYFPDHQVKIRRDAGKKSFTFQLDDQAEKTIPKWLSVTDGQDLTIQLTGDPIKLERGDVKNATFKRAGDQYALKKYKDVWWLQVADPGMYLSNDALESTDTTMYMIRAEQRKPFPEQKKAVNTKIHDKNGKFYGLSEIRPINAIRPLSTMYYNSTS